MKTINIAALKANLSKVLKRVKAGERVTVLDRHEPVAELVATSPASSDPWVRLAKAGKIRLGKQQWQAVKISRLPRRVPIQQLLREVREDER
jgi:prevent-host-death family protein